MNIQDRFDADIKLSPEAYVIKELRERVRADLIAHEGIDTRWARGVRYGLTSALRHLSSLCESQAPESVAVPSITDLMANLGRSMADARASLAARLEALDTDERTPVTDPATWTWAEDDNEAAEQARADAAMADRAFDALGAE
jgi:hypothetical protein